MANWKIDIPKTGSLTHNGWGWWMSPGGLAQAPAIVSLNPIPNGFYAYTQNMTGMFGNCSSNLVANVKVRWQWIGAGPAPTKVWIRSIASASAQASPSAGTLTVSNGLGHAQRQINPSVYPSVISKGTKLEEKFLDGNFLELTFNLTASSNSTAINGPFSNRAETGLNFGFGLRNASIVPDQANYRQGQYEVYTPNLVDSGRLDSAFIWSPLSSRGVLSLPVKAQIVGEWTDAKYNWEHSAPLDYTMPVHGTAVTIWKDISYNDYKQLVISGAGQDASAKLSTWDAGEDEDHSVLPAVPVKVYGHAMIEQPAWDEYYTKGPWTPVVSGDTGQLETGETGTIGGGYLRVISTFFGSLGTGLELSSVYTGNPIVAGVGVGLQLGQFFVPNDTTWEVPFDHAFALDGSGDPSNEEPESEFVGGKEQDPAASAWFMTTGHRVVRYQLRKARASKYDENGYRGRIYDHFNVQTNAERTGRFILQGGIGGSGFGDPPGGPRGNDAH